jgi:hypothetical protein
MTDVVCNEICPSCQKSFTAVRQFIRHKCKSDRASMLLVQRREHVIRNVKTELNRLQCRQRQTRKRSHEDTYPGSGRPHKAVKAGCEIAVVSNPHSQPTHAIDSTGIEEQILYTSETSRREDSTQWVVPDITTVMSATVAELSGTGEGSAPLSNSMWASVDDGWAYAAVTGGGALVDNGWAYAKNRWAHSSEPSS